jgi:hypothetical protein
MSSALLSEIWQAGHSAALARWAGPMSDEIQGPSGGVGRRMLAVLNGWLRRLRGSDRWVRSGVRLPPLKPAGLSGSTASERAMVRARQPRLPEALRRAGLSRRGSSTEGTGATLDLLCRYLEEDGFAGSLREDGTAVETNFRGHTGGFRLVIFVREEPALVGVVVRVPEVAPEAKRPQVAEAVVRANYGLSLGCFEMDMGDGEIDFRAAIPGTGQTLTREQFRALMGSAMWTTDRYHRAFCRLIYGDDLSPAEVIAEVEMADLDHRKMKD